jgi:hypothetical protein
MLPDRLCASAAMAAVLLLGVTVTAAAPALADEQLPCTQFTHLAGFLAQTYGEKPVSAGLQANGQLLQIFASNDTGSWTAVTTSPAGLACVVAMGRYWEQAKDADQVFNPAAYR